MRQCRKKRIIPDEDISIHAPLTGCDRLLYGIGYQVHYFNPRTPYGMRHKILVVDQLPKEISIHAPLTGCDGRLEAYNDDVLIFQSTHPLRDATIPVRILACNAFYFNPRTPYGMRHDHIQPELPDHTISIHAPLTGCDLPPFG